MSDLESGTGEEEPEAPRFAARTDVGRVREANEDSCDDFERADGTRLLVVADGMGGHRGGATASRTTVERIGAEFVEASDSPGTFLARAIAAANEQVYTLSQEDPELRGMGTTVVCLYLDLSETGEVWLGHVGDSRIYRYRRGRLEPLTQDHSYVAEMQRRGLITEEEARIHPRRNEILRSVGVQPDVESDVVRVDVAPGDRFLLCSDGLSGVVQDEEMAAILQSQSPEEAVDTLVDLANERGGPDNITVQIVAMPSGPEGDPEATAPVQVSAMGIELIETRRRQRLRWRRFMAIGVMGIGLGTLAYLWHLVAGIGTAPSQPRPPTIPISQMAPPAPRPPAVPEVEGEVEGAESAPEAESMPAERRTGLPRAEVDGASFEADADSGT